MSTDIYRAIADPQRRKILKMLSHRERTQSELVDAFPISQPAIKKHLTILKEEDLIKERREGRYCYYRLNSPVFETYYRKLQKDMELILDNKLSNLKNYVEEEMEHDGK
jgi:ArsR family transcriptional regulator, arsenate/arsenite/antimonite-responsive transcriptional repressor